MDKVSLKKKCISQHCPCSTMSNQSVVLVPRAYIFCYERANRIIELKSSTLLFAAFMLFFFFLLCHYNNSRSRSKRTYRHMPLNIVRTYYVHSYFCTCHSYSLKVCVDVRVIFGWMLSSSSSSSPTSI